MTELGVEFRSSTPSHIEQTQEYCYFELDMAPSETPRVVIYHNQLLPLSTTFIQTQARALAHFQAGFAGLSPSYGPSLDLNLSFGPILLTRDHGVKSRLLRQIYKRWDLFAGAFLREIDHARPTLIHAHFALDASIALRISELLKVPLITTLHGYDVTVKDEVLANRVDGRIYLRDRERLWSFCSQFLCSCDYIKKRAQALGYPADKLETLYSGHDFAKFNRTHSTRDRNLILFVGRLIEKKGCAYLIKAAALARASCHNLRLAIIGAGPLRDDLTRMARNLNVNCQFLGNLFPATPGNTVMDWMNRARIFCCRALLQPTVILKVNPPFSLRPMRWGFPRSVLTPLGSGRLS